MKVQFKEVMAGSQVLYVPGEVYEINNVKAKSLIDNGICVEFSPTAKEEIKAELQVIRPKKLAKKKKK